MVRLTCWFFIVVLVARQECRTTHSLYVGLQLYPDDWFPRCNLTPDSSPLAMTRIKVANFPQEVPVLSLAMINSLHRFPAMFWPNGAIHLIRWLPPLSVTFIEFFHLRNITLECHLMFFRGREYSRFSVKWCIGSTEPSRRWTPSSPSLPRVRISFAGAGGREGTGGLSARCCTLGWKDYNFERPKIFRGLTWSILLLAEVRDTSTTVLGQLCQTSASYTACS